MYTIAPDVVQYLPAAGRTPKEPHGFKGRFECWHVGGAVISWLPPHPARTGVA